jgi:hypothetical protein
VRDEKESELENLRSVKIFLTNKLKQNEDITSTLQKDIGKLKEILTIDKQNTQKTLNHLAMKTTELKETRQ